MKPILKSLKLYWEIGTSRYEVFPATDAADIHACIQVLEEVRRKELNRVNGNSVLNSHALSGAGHQYALMACRDTKSGTIIGCMRVTPATEIMDTPAGRAEYSLDHIPDVYVKNLYIFTRLAVLKPYRKTAAALVLMAETMVYLAEAGAQGVLMACEPNLYAMYLHIGLRPIGPLHNSPSGGYRVPMILLIDEKYFRSINSPVIRWIKRVEPWRYEDIIRWFREWYQESNTSHFGISMLEDAGVDSKIYEMLTSGFSEAGCRAFMKNAMVIQCQEGDLLIAEQDGSKGLGIVISGKVGVVIRGKALSYLQPGDLFGEIAFVLNTLRTASLVAEAPDTRVMLLSPSAYNRLEDEHDKKCLWRNVATLLAQRVLASDKLLT